MKCAVLLAAICAAALHAQQTGQRPDFTANTDYVEIPVRVLDNKGRFVRNLTQRDFEVLEDGAPQRLVNFSFIGLSSAPQTSSATGTRSGRVSGTRLYAVVIDDVHISREDTVKARSVVNVFIQQYASAADSVAIVFTSGLPGVDLTADRSRVSSALDRLRGQWDPTEPAALKEAKALGVIKLFGQVSRNLGETPRGSRRAIILMTAGVGCSAISSNPSGVPWCGSYMTDALRDAAASDVIVYAIDPRGNRNPSWATSASGPRGGTAAVIQATRGAGDSAPNFYDGMHSLANESGGFSVTGTDEFADAFKRIVGDFGEYYLLGYYSNHRDAGGRLRRNEVHVNRPGTKAFHRSTYVPAN